MSILIKLSGNFFSEKDEMTSQGLNWLDETKNFKNAYVVTGGGNRVRGLHSKHPRNFADKIGTMSSLMNSIILKHNMHNIGIKSKIHTHFPNFENYYSPESAIADFEEGNWVIFGGGLGKVGYISTDFNAVIKALEVKAQGVIKISNINGLFDQNPSIPGAKLIQTTSHEHVIKYRLKVCDMAAIEVAQENDLPIAIISAQQFKGFMNGEKIGSIIGRDWR